MVRSATLPRKNRAAPLRACVPITTSFAWISRARSATASSTNPTSTLEVTSVAAVRSAATRAAIAASAEARKSRTTSS